MIFGGHVAFGGHFAYSLYGRKIYSQETTIFFFKIIFYFIIIGLHTRWRLSLQ